MTRWLLVVPGLLVAAPIGAQDPPGAVRFPRDEEIRLARSAAPATVSDGATVLVLEGGRFVIGAAGTNGVTCLVNRSQPQSVEPHCYDREGAETILKMEIARTELRFAGATKEDADARVARGLTDGTYRWPRRPAMSYMLSAAQVLYSDDGRRVGAWRPHLMIFVPFLTQADIGQSGTPAGQHVFVDGEGTAEATIIVILPAFVEPAPAAGAGSR
jgi:hypothetical protein